MPAGLREKLTNYANRPISYGGLRLPAGAVHRMLARGAKRVPNKTGIPVEVFPGYGSGEEFLDEIHLLAEWYGAPRSRLPPRNRVVSRLNPDHWATDGEEVEFGQDEEGMGPQKPTLQRIGVVTGKVRAVLQGCEWPDTLLYWFRYLALANRVYDEKLDGFSIGTASAEALFHEMRRALPGPNMVTPQWQELQLRCFFLRKCWAKYGSDHPRTCCGRNYLTEVAVDLAQLLIRGTLADDCRPEWMEVCAASSAKVSEARGPDAMRALARQRSKRGSADMARARRKQGKR